jgi:excisionase family DNA binding protein
VSDPRQLPLRFTNSPTISVSRAARIIKCSPQTVRRLIEEGSLHAYRFTMIGWWNIYFDSVVAYLDRLHADVPDAPKENAPKATNTTPPL